MTLTYLLLSGVLGFLVAHLVLKLLLLPEVRAIEGRIFSRQRDFHQTHWGSIPRLGGIALVLAFAAVSSVAFAFFPADHPPTHDRIIVIAAALGMFALGIRDDIRPLGAKKKLLGQLLIATAVYLLGIRIEVFKNPFTGAIHELGVLSPYVTVLWLIAIPNLINLIDGLDGLAAGVCFMLMALMTYTGFSVSAFLALASIGMVGAIWAFFCRNFPRADIYLGDGGAYFLGFLAAVMPIVNSHKGTVVAALIAPLFAMALPILDTSLAIARRGLRGLPLFRADRKHLHHRLLEYGFSRTRAVLLLHLFSLVFLLLAFVVSVTGGRWLPVAIGGACFILLVIATRFNFSRRWFEVWKVLHDNLRLRGHTKYAMALSSWLELEAERCASLAELWREFGFVARKLGFVQMKLQTAEGGWEWEAEAGVKAQGSLQWQVLEFRTARFNQLEFAIVADQADRLLFQHLVDLAGEAWMKAAMRFLALHEARRAVPQASCSDHATDSPLRHSTAKEMGRS
jgi:UDP-GlcNAc:undecaprenyl-phosphate/decaprenyl-phosphate GlcNAc-1-phosphate transferase